MARAAGGGVHEHEPVPSVLLLPGAGGSGSGLHGALLPVPQVHQAEIQPRLVNTDTRTHAHAFTFGNSTPEITFFFFASVHFIIPWLPCSAGSTQSHTRMFI